MATAVVSKDVLKAKFRGCIVGGLVGDCCGCPFEGKHKVSKTKLNELLSEVKSGDKTEILQYTDDTSMAFSIASSLVKKGEIDTVDIAKRFVDEFFKPHQPNRCYGAHVRNVFGMLRRTHFKDVLLPAKMQFDGRGSYGNGAAMRTAPIALFGHSRGEQYIIYAAKRCSVITHTHENGYNGAILMCLAVNAALGLDPSQDLDAMQFVSNLQEKMEKIETKDKPYCDSLKRIKELYLKNQKEEISSGIIACCLGNSVLALESVPTAIYSFLRGTKPIKECKSSNPFVRTIYFAISLGGDTDTIACMAGNIAGAYYGIDIIPEKLQKRCEGFDEIRRTANKLFDVAQKKE